MQQFGKPLIIVGICIIIAGVLMHFSGKIPLIEKLGRLPGDINIQKGNYSFHFPVVTSIIVSIILSLLFKFFSK